MNNTPTQRHGSELETQAHWPWKIAGVSTGETAAGNNTVGYEVVAAACPNCAYDGLTDVTNHGDAAPSYICRRCRSHFTAPTREELDDTGPVT